MRMSVPLLGIGSVRHTRLRPARNAFGYPTYFLLLPLRTMRRHGDGALARNRFAPIGFHDSDHGDGRADCLGWVESLLASQGITDADGEIWLHCYPRVLGFTFKPVSFWYCHRDDGTLAAIVVEVNNTFGERHCYILDGQGLAFGAEMQTSKVFHVSPFCRIEGRYRFRFMRTDLTNALGTGRTVARIEHDDADGPLIVTSISGELAPITPRRIRQAFFCVPFMTFGLMALIHWQAIKLWIKRVPFVPKPAPPDTFATRPNP